MVRRSDIMSEISSPPPGRPSPGEQLPGLSAPMNEATADGAQRYPTRLRADRHESTAAGASLAAFRFAINEHAWERSGDRFGQIVRSFRSSLAHRGCPFVMDVIVTRLSFVSISSGGLEPRNTSVSSATDHQAAAAIRLDGTAGTRRPYPGRSPRPRRGTRGRHHRNRRTGIAGSCRAGLVLALVYLLAKFTDRRLAAA